jgi:hypothetical protein
MRGSWVMWNPFCWRLRQKSSSSRTSRSHSDRPLQSGPRYPVSIRPGSVCRCTSSQKLPSDKRLLPRRVLSHRPNSIPDRSPGVPEQPLGLPSAALLLPMLDILSNLNRLRLRSGVLPIIANEMVTKWSTLFRLEPHLNALCD